MSMIDYTQASQDYQRIEQALIFLEANSQRQPTLSEVAISINLSEYHFQRLFTRWVGISPKRFLQYLTKENAKLLLEKSASLLETAYESGLSGPGRLHDLFVTCEAVTPGEYKQHGAGLTIWYGVHPTPFGSCLLALTERGLCGLAFAEVKNEKALLDDLRKHWLEASLVDDPQATAPYAAQIFGLAKNPVELPLQLYLSGTNFQLKVWEALLRIPPGYVASYDSIARLVGAPSAARAVGNAIRYNPIAYLIPCHRAILKTGDFGNYRYGSPRKKALLGWEMAKSA